MIPYGRQEILNEDIESVIEVLRSDFLTQGSKVPELENAFKNYLNVGNSLVVSSATAALHLGCLALGIGPKSLVWTTPNTFLASANCALYCGADIDFIDIDEDTLNISMEKLASKLESAKRAGRLPDLIIPVHFAGYSCDMRELAKLRSVYKFKILEDASHAIGASYQGRLVGSCEYSDACVFSMHPVKIITTGEGGVLTTNNEAIHKMAEMLRSHGMTRDAGLMLERNQGPWYYEQHRLGFNYRMTDIQAALGVSQLKRVDDYVNRRREIASYYLKSLRELPIILPQEEQLHSSSWHLFVIQVKEKSKISRDELFTALREAGIGVNVHYIPVHTQPFYREKGFRVGDFPKAEKYYSRAITIPLYPTLTKVEQDYIITTLKKLLA